mmetsp:Transcript_98680/g.170871  ORF Transcript_98680/g.170871 Transcript_98680/m.170871 type:complete len:174 (-) Transcript_98680:208-729(-)
MAMIRASLKSLMRARTLNGLQIRAASSAENKGHGFLKLGQALESRASGQQELRHLPVINGDVIYFPRLQPSGKFDEGSKIGLGTLHGAGMPSTPIPKSQTLESVGRDVLKTFEVPESEEITARLFHNIHERAHEARRRLSWKMMRRHVSMVRGAQDAKVAMDKAARSTDEHDE